MSGVRWTEEQLEGFKRRNWPGAIVDAPEKPVDHVPRETKLALEDVQEAPTRKVKDVEHKLQVALFERAAMHLLPHPELEWLHAVPNGGFRHAATAGRMKAEGVKGGIPDISLPVPKSGFHGLYIEMKAPGEITNPKQNRAIRFLREQGYCVQVFDDWYAAWTFIIDYLEERL